MEINKILGMLSTNEELSFRKTKDGSIDVCLRKLIDNNEVYKNHITITPEFVVHADPDYAQDIIMDQLYK